MSSVSDAACPAETGIASLSAMTSFRRPSFGSDSNDKGGRQEAAVSSLDGEDIQEALNGAGDAYARLIARHQDKVAARMWRFTRDRACHEELVHDVFVEAYLSLRTYRGEAPFGHWLARISTAVGYRFWKQEARRRSIVSFAAEDWDRLLVHEPETVDPSHAADLIHSLLTKLPPRDRMVLMLRYVEGRSVEETANLVGWTETMVKVQAWRARKKLKKLLQEAGVEVES